MLTQLQDLKETYQRRVERVGPDDPFVKALALQIRNLESFPPLESATPNPVTLHVGMRPQGPRG